MKLAIYGHSGSENHGNEAIVRGFHELFPDSDLQLFTMSPNNDKKFGLDEIAQINSFMSKPKKRLYYKLSCLLDKNCEYKRLFKPFLKKIQKDRIYCLEAGDQYCESEEVRKWYMYCNKEIRKKGAATVMLGCSITEDIIRKKDVSEDLKNYSLIIARETLTYNLLLKAGINAKLAPCPAFAMKAARCTPPLAFENNKEVIGFNTGFLAQGNEPYYNIMMQNFINAIQFALDATNCNILLIPHVNWNYNTSDFRSLEVLYSKFKNTNRVFLLNEQSAPNIKYILSKLKIFVGLRTHTQIPALACLTPTIIAGYKHKSLGICNDIYGENSKLLAHVQAFKNADVIKNRLEYVLNNYEEIKNQMKENIPRYIQRTYDIKTYLNNLL